MDKSAAVPQGEEVKLCLHIEQRLRMCDLVVEVIIASYQTTGDHTTPDVHYLQSSGILPWY